MNVYILGGSKNIGYYAGLRLLKQGATITYLLRNPNTFDNNEEMQPYIKSGKAKLVRGDAHNVEEIRNGWTNALEAGNGKVDVVLFTVGGTPKFSLTSGLVFSPPDLCTRALLNTLRSMPDALRAPESQPRFVIITSMGCTAASHKALPLALKPLYGSMLSAPHEDKLGMERLLAHCAARPWDAKDVVNKDVLADGWENTAGLLGQGELKHVVIIRPALLTDGDCKADEQRKKGKAPYRSLRDGDFGDGYRVSRKDTAHFIVHEALPNWEKWEGSGVTLAY